MTDAELDAIRARADAATRGPWQTINPGGPNGPFWAICNQQGNVVALRLSQSPEDAKFIAHARADVPALLAEVERLTHERDMSALANEEGVEIIAELRAERDRERDWLRTVVNEFAKALRCSAAIAKMTPSEAALTLLIPTCERVMSENRRQNSETERLRALLEAPMTDAERAARRGVDA